MPPPAIVSSTNVGAQSIDTRMALNQNADRVVPGPRPNGLVGLGDPTAGGVTNGGFIVPALPDGVGNAAAAAVVVPTAPNPPGSKLTNYPQGVFDPTPINPNLPLRISSAGSVSSKSSDGVGVGTPNGGAGSNTAPQRGIERSDSLKFETLFAKDQGSSSGGAEGKGKGMHASSQHLSAMSFSIGDMTEASNLSAVFGDSMRISDDPLPASSRKKPQPATTSSSAVNTAAHKSMNMSGPLDMSMATFSEGSTSGFSLSQFDDAENG